MQPDGIPCLSHLPGLLTRTQEETADSCHSCRYDSGPVGKPGCCGRFVTVDTLTAERYSPHI